MDARQNEPWSQSSSYLPGGNSSPGCLWRADRTHSGQSLSLQTSSKHQPSLPLSLSLSLFRSLRKLEMMRLYYEQRGEWNLKRRRVLAGQQPWETVSSRLMRDKGGRELGLRGGVRVWGWNGCDAADGRGEKKSACAGHPETLEDPPLSWDGTAQRSLRKQTVSVAAAASSWGYSDAATTLMNLSRAELSEEEPSSTGFVFICLAGLQHRKWNVTPGWTASPKHCTALTCLQRQQKH